MIKVICVGKIKEDYLKKGIEEYKKRIGYAAKTSAAAFRNDIVFSEWKSYISSIVDKK